MIKKHNYEAPDAELLVVKFEANFCATGPDSAGGNGWGDNNMDPLDDDNS